MPSPSELEQLMLDTLVSTYQVTSSAPIRQPTESLMETECRALEIAAMSLFEDSTQAPSPPSGWFSPDLGSVPRGPAPATPIGVIMGQPYLGTLSGLSRIQEGATTGSLKTKTTSAKVKNTFKQFSQRIESIGSSSSTASPSSGTAKRSRKAPQPRLRGTTTPDPFF